MSTSTLDSAASLTAPEPEAAVTRKPRSKALGVLSLLTALALGAGTLTYALGRGKQTTDDAQVEGHVASVAPRVSGQVKRVLVRDNQVVAVGDILVELDDGDLAVKLKASQADVAAARAQLLAAQTSLRVTEKTTNSSLVVARGGMAQAVAVRGTTNATITQAEAELSSAESRVSLAKTEFERSSSLLRSGAVSQADYDSKSASLEQANAQATRAQAQLTNAQASISNSSGTLESARGRLLAAETGPEQVEAARAQVAVTQARVEQAEAALAQTNLNLSYTKVRAELAGVVSRRSVEVGQLASPDRPMLAIVPLDDTWVVANFKEDQIREMRPGQAVTVAVDSLDGQELSGHVESLAGATGGRFALLPADNASGNFTKVVQRVPVLIQLDPHPGVELRPGLSAAVTVVTKE